MTFMRQVYQLYRPKKMSASILIQQSARGGVRGKKGETQAANAGDGFHVRLSEHRTAGQLATLAWKPASCLSSQEKILIYFRMRKVQ
jgi:hypothetical protein